MTNPMNPSSPRRDGDSGTARTPGPWFVRKQERLGEVRDCFVAAPDVQGMAYDAEILGDDEYRDGIARKIADAEFIVQCENERESLLQRLRDAERLLDQVVTALELVLEEPVGDGIQVKQRIAGEMGYGAQSSVDAARAYLAANKEMKE